MMSLLKSASLSLCMCDVQSQNLTTILEGDPFCHYNVVPITDFKVYSLCLFSLMFMIFAYMCECIPCACLLFMEAEECIGYHGAEVTDGSIWILGTRLKSSAKTIACNYWNNSPGTKI